MAQSPINQPIWSHCYHSLILNSLFDLFLCLSFCLSFLADYELAPATSTEKKERKKEGGELGRKSEEKCGTKRRRDDDDATF